LSLVGDRMLDGNRLWAGALLAGAALALVAGCGDIRLKSHWLDREIVVDGRLSEWEGLMTYVDQANIAFGLLNDDQNAYISLSTGDRINQSQILRRGLTVWLDGSGARQRTFGIRFPLGARPHGGPGEGKGRGPIAEAGPDSSGSVDRESPPPDGGTSLPPDGGASSPPDGWQPPSSGGWEPPSTGDPEPLSPGDWEPPSSEGAEPDDDSGGQFPPESRPSRYRDSERDVLEESLTEVATELEIVSENGPGEPMKIAEVPGIEVAITRSMATLTYELKVPLHQDADHPYAIGAEPGSEIALGLESPEPERGTFHRPSGRRPEGEGPPGGGMRPPEGGGWGGGRGGGSGPRQALELWATVELATPDGAR
jgi:hypothetical protein